MNQRSNKKTTGIGVDMGIIEGSLRRFSRLSIRDIFEKIIRYRFLLALILFVLLTALRINGSSVAMWTNYLPGSSSTVLSGSVKAIRSDEWMTQTPYYVAQANSKTPYSVVNPSVSLSGQNMLVSYDVPALDISLLAKPLSWGFLFFGPSVGLAWYWNMKIILLFLLSFELCLMITRGKRMVSLFGSFWIALSPAVQWWFMQHVCDVLLYTEAIIVLFVCYLKCCRKCCRKPWPIRLLTAFGFWMSCCGFVLTLYPPIQVPMMYLGLVMMAVFFWNSRKEVMFSLKDAVIIGATGVFAVLVMAHIYLISKDAIYAILHTAYPGARVSTGKVGSIELLNLFLTNPFLAFKDISSVYGNACEASSFYQFLPAVLLSLPVLISRRRGNLKIGLALGAFSLLCVGYMFLPIPLIVAKVTLLSYVTYRIVIVYGVAAMFMSIWALGEMGSLAKEKSIPPLYAGLAAVAAGGFYFVSVYESALKGYFSLRLLVALVLLFAMLSFLLLRGCKWTFSVILSAVILVSGLSVNPVNVGLGALTRSALSGKVRGIAQKEPNARWINLGDFVMGNFLYANGAKTLGGTYYYPDMAQWKLLDPQGRYLSAYNRYAHVEYQLSSQTSFSNPAADTVDVTCTVKDLEKLKITYILTTAELPTAETDGAVFKKVTPSAVNGYYIYRLVRISSS